MVKGKKCPTCGRFTVFDGRCSREVCGIPEEEERYYVIGPGRKPYIRRKRDDYDSRDEIVY